MEDTRYEFGNSSRDDALLLLRFSDLLTEAVRWGVSTVGKDRDTILCEMNAASGRCYSVSGQAPVSRTAQAYVANSNA